MSLEHSVNLNELPDLSNAINLEELNMNYCFNLVEIPSSFGNLQKLDRLDMEFCVNLQVVPTHLNLASLEGVNMFGCCLLRKIPDIFTNITELAITDTMLQDLPKSIRLSCRLQSHIETFSIFEDWTEIDWIKDLWDKRASDINDRDVDIEKLPDWIKDLHGLYELQIVGCPKIASLPELPASLRRLMVYSCESLETLMPFPYKSLIELLYFSNCLKLGQEARRVITQQSSAACLPGRNVPAEFNHRAIGKFLTIPSYRVCVVVSPKQEMKGWADLSCRLSCNGFTIVKLMLVQYIPKLETEHLFISHYMLPYKLEREMLLEFSTTSKDIDIIECGCHIIMDETTSSYESISEQVYENDDESLSEGIMEFDEPRV